MHSAGYLDTRYSVGEVDEVGEAGTYFTWAAQRVLAFFVSTHSYAGNSLEEISSTLCMKQSTCSSDLWVGTG